MQGLTTEEIMELGAVRRDPVEKECERGVGGF
jgi:hypothetical protein